MIPEVEILSHMNKVILVLFVLRNRRVEILFFWMSVLKSNIDSVVSSMNLNLSITIRVNQNKERAHARAHAYLSSE